MSLLTSMKKHLLLTNKQLFVSIGVLIMYVQLIILSNSSAYYSSAFLFVFFITIPGVLLLLLTRTTFKSIAEYMISAIGLSISLLMMTGLLLNQTLLFVGLTQPLGRTYLLVALNILTMLIFVLAYVRTNQQIFQLPIRSMNIVSIVCGVFVAIFPIIASIGAISLNNNGTNMYTLLTLSLIAMYVFMVIAANKHIDTRIYPVALFCITLSLLLMTSLRGWYTTGHDNQLESYMFQLTHEDLTWDIAEYRDPYNASLSITILPSMLSTITGVSGIYVFKVLFQVIFAWIAVAVYLFARNFAGAVTSFLAAFIFISFPSFISSMPMLNRQEIALLLFSLILLTLFSNSVTGFRKAILLILYGAGMMFSHYSTTYIALGLLLLCTLIAFVVRLNPFQFFSRLRLTIHTPKVSVLFVLYLLLITFTWNVLLTKTTAGLTATVTQVYTNLDEIFNPNTRSSDAFYNLFNWKKPDQAKLLELYQTETFQEIREGKDEASFYPLELYNQYPIIQTAEQPLSASRIGESLTRLGIHPFSLNFTLRQLLARGIQLLVGLGVMIIFLRKLRMKREIDTEYLVLSFLAILTLVLFIVLPFLSVMYGTQRLFQQLLVILAFPLVYSVVSLFSLFSKKYAILPTALFFIGIFASFSGLLPQLTGGYYAQLHLNNDGVDYRSYYTHEMEVVASSWLKNHIDSSHDIYTNAPMRTKLTALTGLFAYDTMLPSVIRREAYVFLDTDTVSTHHAIASYNEDEIFYDYPIAFLENNKNLVYSNSGSHIYK